MQADFVLDYDVVTVQQPQKVYLVARLATGPSPQDNDRKPLNLSLVIDHSGSMAGDKLDYTRQAAQFLVQNLSSRDILSIVLYNNRVETLIAPAPVLHKDDINQRLERIRSGGTTNLSGGWLEGITHVDANRDEDFLNRVILMTDGLANRGITETERLVTIGAQKKSEGISTTTMGLGDDFNEDLLIEIANASGGAFYFIESPEVAPAIFQEELRGLLNVVGQNLNISLEPTEHVTGVTQLNAYPEEHDGKRITYSLGDVFGEEIKTLALEMALPAIDELGEQQIATLRFEYDELNEQGFEHRVLEMPVVINIAEKNEQPALPNSEVSRSVLLLKSAQARQEAVEKADDGHYSAASEVLRSAAKAIDESGIDHEALVEEKDALLKQADSMEQGAEEFNARRRKMMSTEAIYTMTDRHMATQALRIREFERVNRGQTPNTQRINGKVPTQVNWGDKQFELDGDLIRIGRAPQNEILIDVNGVSRFHCQIRREDDQLILEDLNSTNGTYVDGEAIKQPHILSVGDEVYVCNEKLVFNSN